MASPKKFWTVREGIIGTAHTSRAGKTVDFRPHVGGWVAQKKITLRPSRGVEIESLHLPAERVSTWDREYDADHVSVFTTWKAMFEGVEINMNQSEGLRFTPEAERRRAEEERTRGADQKEREAAIRRFESSWFTILDPQHRESFIRLIEPHNKEWGLLLRLSWRQGMKTLLARAQRALWAELKLPGSVPGACRITVNINDGFRAELLAIKERLDAERKARYQGRVTRVAQLRAEIARMRDVSATSWYGSDWAGQAAEADHSQALTAELEQLLKQHPELR